MNENDKRVKKTKKLLKEALADLLCEKKIQNITIRELTDKVNVSRNAFYTHYIDIYDLYEKVENGLFDDINRILSADHTDDYKENLRNMIEYIQSNASIMRAFLCSTENYHFRIKLAAYFEQIITTITLHEMNATNLKDDWKYLIKYHSSGIVASFTLWLDTNFVYPKEKLLKMIMDIDKVSDNLYK